MIMSGISSRQGQCGHIRGKGCSCEDTFRDQYIPCICCKLHCIQNFYEGNVLFCYTCFRELTPLQREIVRAKA